MGDIYVKIADGQRFRIDVSDVGKVGRAKLASNAPSDLDTVANMSEKELLQSDDVNFSEIIDYMKYLVTEVTKFERRHVNQFPTETLVELSGKICKEIFQDVGDGTESSENRLKVVRLSAELIEYIFTGELAVVSGLPDDATLYDMEYRYSEDGFRFIFQSSEWETVSDNEDIPVHEIYTAQINSSTKEL